MPTIQLNPENFHDVEVGGKRYAMAVKDTSIFELDEASSALLDHLKSERIVTSESLFRAMEAKYSREQIQEILEGLTELQIITQDPGKEIPLKKKVEIKSTPLTTIVLNVSNKCNMGCHYCYGEGFEDLKTGKQMEWEVAKQSVDFLFENSGSNKKLTVVFFGGEALLNFKLIKQVVPYAKDLAKKMGKWVDFTVTTNATVLNKEMIHFLKEHRFGVTVSIDGPKEIHDQRRVFKGGQGTYDVIIPKVKELLSTYRTRPIGARVTLTRGVTQVRRIFDHLMELGFYEVGFSPVTSGSNQSFALTVVDLAEIYAGFRELAQIFLEKALKDEYLGFSNLSQIIMDFYNGTNKFLPCGAGIGLLDIDHKGDVYLCHRFPSTPGSEVHSYGNVQKGVDFMGLRMFLSEAHIDNKADCSKCWIRHLCAGGCYHEAFTRYGDALHPNLHYCDILRSWQEIGLRVYLEIMEKNPGFITKYLEPRRANYETL